MESISNNVVVLSKEEMNEKTKMVLDLLPYEDAELMHKVILNLAERRGQKWKP
jgi:predicted Zn-dependent protease with MMP-like domain